MQRSSTPNFITEIELAPTGKQAKKLRAKFEAARQVYNACLGEIMRRLRLMRESRAYQAARRMTGKERTAAFRECNKTYAYREYDIHKWATQFTGSWINQHIGARTVECVASTAFAAAQKYSFRKDNRRPPQFRRKNELKAVDGKLGSCCRWKGDHIAWKGIKVSALIDRDDPVILHGLESNIKYVRMVTRTIRGKQRFFAQLVCGGDPYRKESHRPNPGVVGVDIGTQTIAAVGSQEAKLDVFCRELEHDERLVRRVQRALDRSRRANNPDNFNDDGTIHKQGNQRLTWNDSRRYRGLKKRLAELHRKEAAYRKNLHGRLVAGILKLGDDVRMEKLNFRSFQKRRKRKTGGRKKGFGKSLRKRAPSMFVARLKLEANKWGGSVTEFETRTTKLSQTCHCGYVKKKGLGQRWHRCKNCGVEAQRDLYSAFLARFVEGNRLNADLAQAAWSSGCTALEAALSDLEKDAMGGLPSSLGLRTRDRAPRLRDGEQNRRKAVDVVAELQNSGESHGERRGNHQSTVFFSTDSSTSHSQHKGSVGSGEDTG